MRADKTVPTTATAWRAWPPWASWWAASDCCPACWKRADNAPDCPFIRADLTSLEDVLEALIGLGPDMLASVGRQNRAWLERYWDCGRQWTRFWQPAIEAAIRVAEAPHREPPFGGAAL